MSIFKTKKTPTRSYEQAIVEVGVVLETVASLTKDKTLMDNMLGLESLSDDQLLTVSRPVNEVINSLRATSLTQLMVENGFTEQQILTGLEHAAYQVLTFNSGKKYYNASENKVTSVGEMMEVVHSTDEGVYGLESFDPISVEKYMPATIVAMAMTRNSKFEELFFPTQFVPAGSSGFDLIVKMPIIYSTTPRSTSGDKFNIVTNPLVAAVMNPSILEGEQTTLVPWADDADAKVVAALVAAAKVPTFNVAVGSIQVPTRPIKFAADVDLISLSGHPGLLANHVYDETDQLDSAMNIGKVYYEVTIDDGVGGAATRSAVYEYDISRAQMSQLNKNPSGQGQDYLTGLDASVLLTNTAVPLSGSTQAEMNTAISTAYALTPGQRFTLISTMVLSATANTNDAHMRTFCNQFKLTELYKQNGDKINAENSIVAGTTITITGLGYFPQTRRTNSNMRSNGIIVDMHVAYTYRYYLTLSAPIISQTPINGDNMITLDGLTATAKLRTSGRCVKEMLKLEQMLKSVTGLTFAEKLPGERAGVTPSYVPRVVDVAQEVATLSSRENIPALQGALVSAISLTFNQMIKQSNYIAALEANGLSSDAFDLILVTDNAINPLLMTAGDLRTFGENRDYKIAASSNNDFHGKIYLALTLKNSGDEMHPLCFGRLLETPSLTYQGNFQRNGRTTTEVHTVVRAKPYVLLPVLGVIEVQNLHSLYVTSVG